MTASKSFKNTLIRVLHPLVHIGALVPLILLGWQVFTDPLAGDPVEILTNSTGKNALRFLLLSLCITPLAKQLKAPLLLRLRRPLGLWSFAFASLHFCVWLSLDLQFMWGIIGEEIVKRNYLLVGFTAWLILLPLAITSIPILQKKMGASWKKLHHWVYLVAVLAPVHFLWAVKSEIIEPSIYLAISLLLLGLRYKTFLRPLTRRQKQPAI